MIESRSPLNYLVSLAAVGSCTALGLYELRRYRTRYGITFTSGPWPTSWPDEHGFSPGAWSLSEGLERLWVDIRPPVVLLSAWALFLIGLLNTAATALLLVVALLGDPEPFLEVSIGVGLLAFWFLAAWYVLRYGREQGATDLTIRRMLGTLVDRMASTRR